MGGGAHSHLQMRRLSTVATAGTAPSRSRLSLLGVFQQQPIEELPELKSIQSVQHLVAKIPAQPAARQLTESGAHRRWLETYRGTNTFRGQTQLNKDGFDAFVREVAVYLQKLEDEAFQSSGKIGALQESDLDSAEAEAYVEAIKLKMSRHMCMQAATCFELLDRDNDGKVQVEEVEQLLQVAAHGNSPEWLKSQFRLYDADGDEIVTEAETKLILESMIATQKAVMTELFGNNVDCLPKKHEKLFAKSLSEEDWKSKIPEKVRCVFHFANKLDEKRKTLDWELFEESQKAEFPELHNMLAVYAKGFYDERFTFYERKQDKRSTRYKGLLLATAIGVGDYLAAVI